MRVPPRFPFVLAALVAAPLAMPAHAIVIVWTPETIALTLPGATDAEVDDATVIYEPCEGDPVEVTGVSGDLLTGLDLDAPEMGLCRITLELAEDLHVFGANGTESFEVIIDAGDLWVEGEPLPSTVPYTVVSGTVTSAASLDLT